MTVKLFFGWLFLVVGGLLAAFSGLCSIVLLANNPNDPYVNAPMILIIGGIPCLVGIGLFFLGRFLKQSDGRSPE